MNGRTHLAFAVETSTRATRQTAGSRVTAALSEHVTTVEDDCE